MNSIRALTVGVLVLICALLAPGAASAAECDTWQVAESGEWSNAGDWSKGVPGAGTDVCIEKPVTVTVPLGYHGTLALGSLDVGGETTSGTATLQFTTGKDMTVSTATIGAHGVIDLDGTYKGGEAGNATLGGGTITNHGTIEMKGNGYWATLFGTIINEGTISNPFGGVILGGEHAAGSSLDNKGMITVGPTPAKDEAAGITDEGLPVTDDTGGSIGNEGTFYVKSAYNGSTLDGAYIQGNGNETGNPIEIGQNSSLAYTGPGASSVKVADSLPMTGSLSTGQSLQIGIGTVVTEPSSFTNAGSILLNGNYYGGGGGPAEITVPSGATFTNTGTLTAESDDNDPTLSGNFVNDGTVSIKSNTQLEQAVGTFTNAGGGTFAPQISSSSFGEVRIDSEASFVAGGTLAPVLIEGFVPTIGQEFHVVGIRGGSWSGQFGAVVDGFGADYSNSGYIGAIYGGGVTGPTPISSPVPSPAPVTVAATAGVSSVSGGAGSITIKLSCSSGGTNCARDSIVATITEHRKHGKLTGVSAARHIKVVVIASGSLSLKAGSSVKLKLLLNRTGQALLKRYRSLTAIVTVSSAGKKIKTVTVHIHEPVQRHRR